MKKREGEARGREAWGVAGGERVASHLRIEGFHDGLATDTVEFTRPIATTTPATHTVRDTETVTETQLEAEIVITYRE